MNFLLSAIATAPPAKRERRHQHVKNQLSSTTGRPRSAADHIAAGIGDPVALIWQVGDGREECGRGTRPAW